MPTVKRKSRPIIVEPKVSEGQFVAWGPPAFGPSSGPDEADGARIGRTVLRRGPDGELVGIVEPEAKP